MFKRCKCNFYKNSLNLAINDTKGVKRHVEERRFDILSCYAITLKYLLVARPIYSYLVATMSIFLHSMLPNLVNILITNTDYLAGGL